MQMQPIMAAYNVTTDHIQQYLDENKSLILKIVESQNSGKLSECAENQSRLQRNLMYLAAIADSQPQLPAFPGQYPPSGFMQQGGNYTQAQQQQQFMYSQEPFSLLEQQHALQCQLGTSSSASTGLHMYQSEATNAAVGSGGFPDFGRGLVGKQLDIGSSSGGGGGGEGHSGERGESLYLKPASDNNDGLNRKRRDHVCLSYCAKGKKTIELRLSRVVLALVIILINLN